VPKCAGISPIIEVTAGATIIIATAANSRTAAAITLRSDRDRHARFASLRRSVFGRGDHAAVDGNPPTLRPPAPLPPPLQNRLCPAAKVLPIAASVAHHGQCAAIIALRGLKLAMGGTDGL